MEKRRSMASRVLLLAAALLLVGTAAFAGGQGDKSKAASPPAAGAARPEKNLAISVGMSMPDPSADAMGTWIQDKFNFTLRIVSTDGDKLKMLAAADDMPDVFAAALGDTFFNQLRADDFIREIPDSMIDKYPNVKKYMGVSDITQTYKALTGKYYSIPRESDVDKPPRIMLAPMYYRADWAKKVGMAAPKTAPELYQLLRAFTVSDPDGNGKNDTFGTTGWLWQVHFIPWVDIYSWIKEDGKWVPGYVSKNMVDALAFYNRLYKEKILDPEFAVAKQADMFYTGKVGMIMSNGDQYWLWNTITVGFAGANKGVDAMEAVKLLPPISKDASSAPVWPRRVNNSATMFSAKCGDDKLERMLQFFHWTLSPEGRDFALYGFLDKDYIIKDGKAVSILPNKENVYGQQKPIWDVYPSVNLFNLVRWYAAPATEILNPIYPKAITDLYDQYVNVVYGPRASQVNVFVDSVMTPAKEKFNVGLGDIEAEFGRIISSTDAASEFAVYRRKLLEVNGLQKVIDEVTAEVARQGLDKK